ncbi:MFS transporter [Deltaproteobacteria bacterium TL4]
MPSSPESYQNKWLVMSAVAMGLFLATIDGSIVNIALPTIVKALNTDFSVVQWVVLSYLLTVTTLMLSIGRLADIMGKKSLYLSGFIIFTISSVLCGLAHGVYWLIVLRIVQGIGSALIMALGAAIITEAFPPTERGKAMGVVGTIVSLGIITGPTLGGIIIELLSWRWIFLVNLPVGIVGIYMVIRFIPSQKPRGGQKFDYWGAITLFISLSSFLLALTFGQQKGFLEKSVIALFVSWFISLIVFLVIEKKTTEPVIKLSIFKNKMFSYSVGSGFMTFVAVSGSSILMPFFMENVLNYTTLHMGLLMGIVPFMMGISSPLAGHFSDRFGSRKICLTGLILIPISYFLISRMNEASTALEYILIATPLGIGMGIFQAPNNSVIMGSVPRESLGIASGLLSITRTLGQTVGIAIFGAIWATRTRFYAGVDFAGKTTKTPLLAQVSAFQDTFLIASIMLTVALIIFFIGTRKSDY